MLCRASMFEPTLQMLRSPGMAGAGNVSRCVNEEGLIEEREQVMFEVCSVGGGEYLVNIFNAVATWSGGGGYRSLIRVVMVMGLIYSLLVVAFTLNYKA